MKLVMNTEQGPLVNLETNLVNCSHCSTCQFDGVLEQNYQRTSTFHLCY